MPDLSFYSPKGATFALDDVVREIVRFMAEVPGRRYEVTVGTDSQEYKNGEGNKTDFVSVIVVHRVGRGGRYFWRKMKKERLMALREKIYEEATLSLMLAMQLGGKLRDYLQETVLNGSTEPLYKLEIHVDIGANGPTREMIKEIVGMIRGNGFAVRTKPEAYAASIVADKHT